MKLRRRHNRSLALALATVVLGTLLVSVSGELSALTPSDGLVGSWALDGNVTDATVNANNGQLNGGASFGTGNTGQGLVLSGTGNSHAAIPNSASLNTVTTAMTASAWIKPSAAPSGFATIVSRQLGTGSNDQFDFVVSGTTLGLYLNTSNGGNQPFFGPTVTIGQWSHVAFTYDGANVRFYLNGALTGAQAKAGSLAVTDRPLLIGANANSAIANTAEELFAGSIDTVCVQNRALALAEIATQNTCPVSGPGTTTTTTTAPVTTTIAPVAGQTVFTDSYLNGWSAQTGGTIEPSGGNPAAMLNRTAAPAFEGMGASTGSPAGAFTTMTFDLKSNVPVALGIYANSGATQPIARQAPASPNWTRYTCSFAAFQTAWPWVTYKHYAVGGTGNISLDNIQLGYGTQATDTCQPGGPTTTPTTTTTTIPATITTIAATTTTPTGPSAGPIGEWHFNSNVNDSTSNANHGSLIGSAAIGTGKTGSGLVLTGGGNGHALVPQSSSINAATSAMSFSAWVKPTVLGYVAIASRQQGTANNDQFNVGVAGTALQFYLNTSNGGNQGLTSGTALPVGVWSHVAFTYDGLNMRIFLNGTQVAAMAKTGSITAVTTPLLLGGNANDAVPNTAQELLNGTIDDACLYNRALSASEIATQNTCPAGGTSTPITTTIAPTTTTIPAVTTTTIAPQAGQTVFTDSYQNGWSAQTGGTIEPTGGNPAAMLNRVASPAYEGIGASTGSPAGAFTTMTFDLKSNVPVALGIYANSGATQPIARQAPASPNWTRYTCSFAPFQTAWPWVTYKHYAVGGAGNISIDNIQLGYGTQPTDTCQPGGPTTTTSTPPTTTNSLPTGIANPGTCAVGDGGGTVIFDNQFLGGWGDGSWDTPGLITATGGVNGSAGYTGTRDQWKAIGGWKSSAGGGIDTLTFTAKGSGSWRINGSEGSTNRGSQVIDISPDWKTYNCRLDTPIVGGPASFSFQNIGSTATITVDNIKWAAGATAANLGRVVSSTSGLGAGYAAAPTVTGGVVSAATVFPGRGCLAQTQFESKSPLRLPSQ